MFWHLAAAAAYLVCASAAADIAGNLVVKVLKPRLTDPGSDQGKCCREPTSLKVQIYQAVPDETVIFQVYAQVAEDAPTSADNYMTITVQPIDKTGCNNRYQCGTRNCSYSCEPKIKASINGSECYNVVATSRIPDAKIKLPICVYNRRAEPPKVLSHQAASFDNGSVTLKYEVGGYPLPASITVTCYEQTDGRTAHDINASISFIEDSVGHYAIQLDNLTAGEIRCRVTALGEFHNVTSETDVINVTSAYKLGATTEQFVGYEVTAATANADASIIMPTASGMSKDVIVGLAVAAGASTVLIAIAVGVAMWRRSTTRIPVTNITNENYHTTIVNNDNRQTIVNNCQHNYVDPASHSGVVDINELLLAWDDGSTSSNIDRAIHGPFRWPHEDSVRIQGDSSEGVS